MPTPRPPAFYEDMVNAINDLFGAHRGHRAAHAKGTLVTGTFRPTPAARELSRAPHFSALETHVTARFSNGSGNPQASDLEPDARGLAVKFHLPDGRITDLVAITIPAFFVRTPEDFVEFTRVRKPDPSTGKPDPTKVSAFVARHPETAAVLAQLGTHKPATSYASSTYNGIHTFALTNAAGATVHARYRMTPVGAEPHPPAPAPSVDAFQEHLRLTLAAGPVRFELAYVLSEPGDRLDDPTVAWPATRPWITAGTIELNAVAPSAEEPDRTIFDPNNVIDGIACSNDEILHARGRAYGVSYARRTAT